MSEKSFCRICFALLVINDRQVDFGRIKQVINGNGFPVIFFSFGNVV